MNATKEIPIRCKGSRSLPYAEFKSFQGNLKNMSREDEEKLRGLILKHGWIGPVSVWNNAEILDGHARLFVLGKLLNEGYSIKKIPVVDIYAKTRKEAAEMLLAIDSRFNRITQDGLSGFMEEFDLDLADLNNISLPDINMEEFEVYFTQKNQTSSETEKQIEPMRDESFNSMDYDYFYFEFSGGKDSTLAMLKVIPMLRDAGKPFEAIFVSTGAELPDLIFHVITFCLNRQIPLEILHPQKDIVMHYLSRHLLPDPIFRECMHEFIYKPIDDYVGRFIKEGKRVLGIRGGRKDQKTTKSKAGKLQEIERNGLKYLVYSPLYDLNENQYSEELLKIEKWPGYDRGFIRTACWFCPFTHPDQWEAIRENYPLLFGPLVEISKLCKMPHHKGDGNYPRYYNYFKKYW